jgi:hypothetical protein
MTQQRDDEPGMHNEEQDREGAQSNPPEPRDQEGQKQNRRPEEEPNSGLQEAHRRGDSGSA